MDPDKAIWEVLQFISRSQYEEAINTLSDLIEWMEKGGFAPTLKHVNRRFTLNELQVLRHVCEVQDYFGLDAFDTQGITSPAAVDKIIKQSRARAKHGHWSDQISRVITAEQDAYVRAIWKQLPGHTSYADALYRILNGEVTLDQVKQAVEALDVPA